MTEMSCAAERIRYLMGEEGRREQVQARLKPDLISWGYKDISKITYWHLAFEYQKVKDAHGWTTFIESDTQWHSGAPRKYPARPYKYQVMHNTML